VSVGFAQFGVEPLRFVELVLEGDDAARRFERCAVVKEFANAGGQA
jgi:hypothetical protein